MKQFFEQITLPLVMSTGDEKKKEKEMLTKLMKYVQENNSRKFVEEFSKIRDKEHLKTILNTQINNTYLIVQAAKINNLNIVKLLVQQKHGNISYTDKNGKNALIWSCYNNNDKMCKYLINHGADPNIVTLDGNDTPLIQAAYSGNLNIMKYLFGEEEKKCFVSFDWVCNIIKYLIHFFIFLFLFLFLYISTFYYIPNISIG